jgi:CBS domain-containing protein
VATAPTGPDSCPNGSPQGTHAFTNLASLISRALTQYKDVVTVSPDTPAREAIRLLTQHRFWQVPVVDRGQVAGLFSYRSFSLAVVNAYDLPGRHRADGLSVWECIETPAYVQDTDEFQRLFDELDRRDAVLVGSRGRCAGLLTAMGVLRYLFEAASPFLLVAEIELSLRALIELAVDPDELGLFASASLTHYKPENMPAKLEDMTFNDYVLLIGHGSNWERFNRIFHADRALTHAKLKQVRDLRNDIFHFRRGLADRERDTLTASRDWMLRLVTLAGGQAEWV